MFGLNNKLCQRKSFATTSLLQKFTSIYRTLHPPKKLPKYGDYIVVSYCQSGKLPFMPHIWQFSTAHFPLYLQDSSHAGILMWYEAWSQSTIKGVLLSACITPIYFSVLWMLTFTCFLKLMLWLWIVSNSLISLLKTLSGWPVLFRFGTYRIQFKSINWTLA